MADTGVYWNSIFETKASVDVSWYQAEPFVSLRLIEHYATHHGSVVDIGAGTSTLVDALLERGDVDLTVLDVSSEALAVVRARLGKRASLIDYVVGEVGLWRPTRTYDVWHDRAVFHFLVEAEQRERYMNVARRAVAPGGAVIIATFATDGPIECSGLPTARYGAEDLAREFGGTFTLEHAEREEHSTPWGAIQPFTWVVLRHDTLIAGR